MSKLGPSGLAEDEEKYVGQIGAVLAHVRLFSTNKNPSSLLRQLYIARSGIFNAPLDQAMERLVETMKDRKYLYSDVQTRAFAVLPDLQRMHAQISLIQHPVFIRVEHKGEKSLGSMSSGILAQLDDVIRVAMKS